MSKHLWNRADWFPLEMASKAGSKTSLYNKEENRFCCIGLYLRDIGFSPELLEGISMPHHRSINPDEVTIPTWLLASDGTTNSRIAYKLAGLNDANITMGFRAMTMLQREAAIIKEFAKFCDADGTIIEVEFFGILEEEAP